MRDYLVEVAKFRSSIEASLALGQLEEAGINACLTNEASAGALTYLGATDVGVGLLVSGEDAAKATQLLAVRPPKSTPQETDTPEEVDELNVKLTRAWRAAILGLFFFPLSFYSLWLLLRYRLLSPDSAEHNHKAVIALVLAVVGLSIGVFFLFNSVFANLP